MTRKSNKPMSLDEIIDKFQVDFPFLVKKLVNPSSAKKDVEFPLGQRVDVAGYWVGPNGDSGYVVRANGETYWTPHGEKQWVLI